MPSKVRESGGVTGDQAGDVRAVTILIGRARVTGHKTLAVHHAGQSEKAPVKIGMVDYATVNQRHSDSGAGITGLPRGKRIDRGRGIAQRRTH